MSTYIDHVAKLFEEQGFTITRPDDKPDLIAQNETTLHIFCSKDLDEQLIDTMIAYETENDTLVFTPDELSTEQQDQLDDHNIQHSRFDPSQDDQQVETPPNMPSSYEIIGDIAILNLDEEPDNIDEIAKTVTQQNPSVNTVLRKTGQLSGEFRVGDYDTLRGKETETTHTEHGCRYKIDPTASYFSERLGHERERVIDKIEENEQFHVWFAGVGPYAILAARKTDLSHVHAIEKNPDACEYLETNITLNDVDNTVTPHCGDVRTIAPTCDPPDRIVMPLPGSADAFLELALELINDNGVIHYYRFAPDEDTWTQPEQEIEQAAANVERDVTIDERTICGHYAPYIHRICIDIRVND